MTDPDDQEQTTEQAMAPREEQEAPQPSRREPESETGRWVSERIQEMF